MDEDAQGWKATLCSWTWRKRSYDHVPPAWSNLQIRDHRHRIPTTPSHIRGRHRTRARRWEGPRAAGAAGARAPPWYLLPDREPREDAAGTESAGAETQTRGPWPQSPEREDATASLTAPLGTPPPPNSDPLGVPAQEAPPPQASLSPHLLLPPRVLRSLGSCPCGRGSTPSGILHSGSCGGRVLIGMDASPRPPDSSVADPEETWFLPLCSRPHVLQKPPQLVLRRRPHSS